jgi:GH24 family phage-related lysozyme (muramidase)
MSIFRNTINSAVSGSLAARQNSIQKRDSDSIIYQNFRNSWIRMTSGVNVNGSNALANNYVMLGGVLLNKKSRFGVGDASKAYSTGAPSLKPYNTDAKAGTAGIKPMPGITALDCKSKTAYGSLREVTVNFVCNNIQQLEDLELLYMRPGYTVLVEWGWTPYLNNKGKLENNISFYDGVLEGKASNGKNDREQIFLDLFKKSNDHFGNYEAHYGYVKNYSWTARMDGGYDCTTTIISVGELLESLNANWVPMNVASIAENGLLVPDKPVTTTLPIFNPSSVFKPITFSNFTFSDIENPKAIRGTAYSQNVLAGLLYELYTYCAKELKASPRSIVFDKNIKTEGKPSYDMYVFKYPIKSTLNNSLGDDTIQAYITLESFTDLINEQVALAFSDKEFFNVKPFSKLSTKPPTYNVEDITPATSGSLLCLAHPLQLSIDPSICIITSPIWASGVSFVDTTSKSTQTLPSIPYLKALQSNSNSKNFRYGNYQADELGNLGYIYLNINKLYQLSIDASLQKDGELKVFDFLKTVLKQVQESIGGVNNFEIHIDPIDSVARIIDLNYVDFNKRDEVYNKAFEIQMSNLSSVVRSYNLQSQIFPEQANLIALGAQLDGSGNQSSQNATLLDFNRNIEDRIMPKKLSSTNGSLNTNVNLTNKINSIEIIRKNLSASIEKMGTLFVPNSSSTKAGDQIAKPTQISNTEAKAALSSIIRYFQGVTTSNTKNRAIIPVKISLTMDGIGGLIIGHLFKIPSDLLPKGYRSDTVGGKLLQIVTGISHKVDNGDWTTTIDALNMIASDPRGSLKFSDLITLNENGTATLDATIDVLTDLQISGDYINRAADFIKSKENFTSTAEWDQTAYRLGYGTDKILDNGRLRDVKAGDTTTENAAELVLQYQIKNEYQGRVVRDIGQSAFDKLNANQKAALISYAYNVGSLSSGIKESIKQNNLDAAALYIKNGVNTVDNGRTIVPGLTLRREQEAALFNKPV